METESDCKRLPAGYQLGSSRHLYRVDKALSHGGFSNTYVCTNLKEFCPNDSDSATSPLAERLPSIREGRRLVIKEHYPRGFAHRKGVGESDAERYTIVPNTGCEAAFDEQEASFFSEANALWKLYKESQCPNIVPVLHAAKSSKTHITYFVMPYLTGGSLDDWRGKVTPGNLMFLLYKLLEALQVVHGKGMQHRDIKPKNIMLAHKGEVAGVSDGEPVLIDFGLVETRTTDGLNAGSMGYMPWEQFRNSKTKSMGAKSGPWTDIYSLGATCYELITGERPPDHEQRAPWMQDPYVPLSQQQQYVERYGANLLLGIDWALRVDYTKRWQSAGQWLEYLKKIQAHSEAMAGAVPDLKPAPLPIAPLPEPPSPENTGVLELPEAAPSETLPNPLWAAVIGILIALGFLGVSVYYGHKLLKEMGLITAAPQDEPLQAAEGGQGSDNGIETDSSAAPLGAGVASAPKDAPITPAPEPTEGGVQDANDKREEPAPERNANLTDYYQPSKESRSLDVRVMEQIFDSASDRKK